MLRTSAKLLALAALLYGMPAVPAYAFSGERCQDWDSAQESVEAQILDLDTALGRHPRSEDRTCEYYNRGLLYERLGKHEQAIDDFTRAIGWMDRFGDAYAARGDVYEQLGQHDKAAEDYALAAQNTDDSPGGLGLRCWLRAMRGYPLERALEDCNAALRQEPDSSSALTGRALVYFRMSKYATAIADSTAAIKGSPRDATALYIRGLAESRLGDSRSGDDIAAARRGYGDVERSFTGYGIKP